MYSNYQPICLIQTVNRFQKIRPIMEFLKNFENISFSVNFYIDSKTPLYISNGTNYPFRKATMIETNLISIRISSFFVDCSRICMHSLPMIVSQNLETVPHSYPLFARTPSSDRQRFTSEFRYILCTSELLSFR